MIPPYLEIEGQSEADVLNAVKLLGLQMNDIITQDVNTIYSTVYGINLESIKVLKFNDEENVFISKFWILWAFSETQ